MSAHKTVIIGLAVVLAAVIGYAVYLYQGPLKNYAENNNRLSAEIEKLKTTSKDTSSTYRKELEGRDRQIKALQTENSALEEAVAKASKEKKDVESDLEKLVLQLREDTERIEADLQSEVDRLENQLSQKQQELETSQIETRQLKTALENIKTDHQTEITEKIRLVEELQRKSGELEQTVIRTRKETEQIEAELSGTITNLKDQLTQRESELQASRNETQQLRTVTDEAKAAYKAELAAKVQLVSDLQRKSGELEGTLSRIKTETETLAADLQSTITGLESQLAQWDRELQTSRMEAEALRSTITDLENNNEALSKQLDESNRQLLASKRSNEELNNELTYKNRKIEGMETDRQQMDSKIAMLDKEKEELARLKDALRNQLGMSQSQIESLSSAAAVKDEQLKSKEQQLESMERAYAELSKQFEQQIKEKEIKISSLENKLNIRLLDKILFASGSADISSVGNRVLDSLAAELKKMKGFEISVAGHTDNKPIGPKIKRTYYDNLGLSVARAAAVSRRLNDMGVSPENLSAVGFSMYRPIAANETKEGRQQNRRVEIILEPLR